MRHRTSTAALTLTAALLLGGCTSEDPEPDTVDGTDDNASAPSGEAGLASDTGWFCSMISEDLVGTATGGDLASAREQILANDEGSWECEVNQVAADGTSYETLLRLSAGPVEEATEEGYRTELSGAEEVTRGPEYMGEGYLAPGQVVALMDCNTPPQDGQQGSPVPHAFTLEVLTGPATELTDELASPVRRLITEIDRSVGCFPGDAYEAAPPAEG